MSKNCLLRNKANVYSCLGENPISMMLLHFLSTARNGTETEAQSLGEWAEAPCPCRGVEAAVVNFAL